MYGFARLGIAFTLGAWSIAALIACSGKSESNNRNDGEAGDAGAGGSNTTGGSAGSSTGGAGRGGSSGSSSGGASGTSAGGTSGTATGGASGTNTGGGSGGTPMCTPAPIGTLCVRGTPDGENESLAVGDPLRVQLNPQGCFSSSCTEPVIAECSVTGGGPALTVTGEFCLTSNTDPGVGCTDDCGGGGYAECQWGEPLEAGDYTVTLGALSVSFTVPGSLRYDEACDGSQF
jgi:hypothetical protein